MSESTRRDILPKGHIPEFQNYEEEAEFWDTHEFSEFWYEAKPVELHVAEHLSEYSHGIKHKYIDGQVYTMSGGSLAHGGGAEGLDGETRDRGVSE